MIKHKKTAVACIFGLIYGILAVFLAGLLLRNLGLLATWLGKLRELEGVVSDEIIQVLEQLRRAQIGSPWLLALVPTAAAGGLSRCGKRGSVIAIILGIVLFLPLMLGAACLTKVNGIHFGALLGQLIPLLPALL